MPKSALIYLKEELNFKLSEWQGLSPADKEWYKKAAEDEMKVRGIEITVKA